MNIKQLNPRGGKSPQDIMEEFLNEPHKIKDLLIAYKTYDEDCVHYTWSTMAISDLVFMVAGVKLGVTDSMRELSE